MKKTYLSKLITTLLLLILTNCQALREEHQRQMAVLCTYEGAYSAGVQDYENGEGSNALQKLSGCDAQTRGDALRGYNDGYAQIKSQPNSIGGIIDLVIDKTRNSVFSCEITVFNDTYRAKGRTRNEALFNTKQDCTSKRADKDFFCKNLSEYRCGQVY